MYSSYSGIFPECVICEEPYQIDYIYIYIILHFTLKVQILISFSLFHKFNYFQN